MPAIIPIVAAVGGALVSGAMNKKANDASAKANNAAADAAGQQAAIAKQQYEDWTRDFLPLQGDLAARAKTIGGPEEQARAAELANADVTQAYGRAKADLTGRLSSYGIDPSAPKYATAMTRFGLGEAAAGAGAQNKARDDLSKRADAFKMDFYNAGKGTPSSAMAGLGASASANANLARGYQDTASRNAAGIGSLVQKVTPGITNWWNSRPAVPKVDPYEVDMA